MSCEQATAQALRESGHRLTPQRLMILSVIRHSELHVTASEIYDQVKASYPYIDVSTVYRTLSVLKQMRLVSETDMGGGEYRYEWINHLRHHHLICRGCDKVVLLDHKYWENIGADIMADYGFQPDIDHIALFGICHECLEHADSE